MQRGDWKMRVTEVVEGVAEGVVEASFRAGARHARKVKVAEGVAEAERLIY